MEPPSVPGLDASQVPTGPSGLGRGSNARSISHFPAPRPGARRRSHYNVADSFGGRLQNCEATAALGPLENSTAVKGWARRVNSRPFGYVFGWYRLAAAVHETKGEASAAPSR